MQKIINKIFSVRNEDLHKVWTICGVKLKFKLNNVILKNLITNYGEKLLNENKKIINNCNSIDIQTKKTNQILQNLKQLNNERIILPNDYYPYLENNNLVEDYLNLIRGLDETSIINVQKALARIQQLKNTGNELYYLNNEEIRAYNDYISDFDNAIVQLDENIWAYKDYLLPVSFFDASVFYMEHNLKDYTTIDYNKSVIDAGASIGDSAVFFSKLFKGNIYSFEPTEELFKILNKTIQLNNLQNVYPQKMGLLNECCNKNIYFAGRCGQSTSINEYRDNGNNGEEVHFTTIDKFVAENNIEVGLIKADVEGAESLLLEGALETIKKQKPALNISIYHSARDFFKLKPMIEELGLGYKFKITRPSLNNIIVETCLLAEVE